MLEHSEQTFFVSKQLLIVSENCRMATNECTGESTYQCWSVRICEWGRKIALRAYHFVCSNIQQIARNTYAFRQLSCKSSDV